MKKVILFLCFMPVTALSQVSYNFETGLLQDWMQSANNHWAADTVSPVSGSYTLHHVFDNNEAATDQIGIRLKRLRPSEGTTKWVFTIKHGSDPSSTNNWSVFLMADNDPAEMHPGGNISGFAIGVNLSGYDDTLRLWKIKAGNTSGVMTLPVNWQTDIGTATAARIEIERSKSGTWKATVYSITGSLNRTSFCTDPEFFPPLWFGIFYKYTSTRDRLLWIDDISIDGVFLDPSVPPKIEMVSISGSNSLEVIFDDEISTLSAFPGNFLCIPESMTATDVIILDRRRMRIVFPDKFPNKRTNTLEIKYLCDIDSICAEHVTIDFTPARDEPGDIIISEIMADPSPPVSLPSEEYIEITNTSIFSFSLNGWKLYSGNDSALFPDASIGPKEIIILCSPSDTGLFSGYGRVIGIKSFPALNDEGKCLVLSDELGKMIHCLCFSGSWYGDKLKEDGGWSLEMIDTQYPFSTDNNWKASVSSSGGTPGSINSVSGSKPDISFKGIFNVFPPDSSTIVVTFTEPVRNPETTGESILIDNIAIRDCRQSDLTGTEFKIVTGEKLKAGNIHKLALLSDVSDYAGNHAERNYYMFGLPEKASVKEVVFNEILFNPLPGDADFIEFYNTSGKIIDASSLFISSVNDETGDTSELLRVSDYGRCFLPGIMYTITTDRKAVLNRYFSSGDTNIFEVERMPSMADDKGHIILFNRQLEKLDEVKYNEKMHFPLLAGFEGISLEKIRPSCNSPDQKNWHSASESSGWGTPGAVNSVFTALPVTDNILTLSSTRITPNNDGNEDLLVMDLRFTGSDNVVSVLIFDETGNLVRRLARNLYAGSTATLAWDATSDDGSAVSSGIYVILISVFDETGKTMRLKKACSVIR